MPTIFVAVIYYMVNFNQTLYAYAMFILIGNLVANCGMSFGTFQFSVSCSNDFELCFCRLHDFLFGIVHQNRHCTIVPADTTLAAVWWILHQQQFHCQGFRVFQVHLMVLLRQRINGHCPVGRCEKYFLFHE